MKTIESLHQKINNYLHIIFRCFTSHETLKYSLGQRFLVESFNKSPESSIYLRWKQKILYFLSSSFILVCVLQVLELLVRTCGMYLEKKSKLFQLQNTSSLEIMSLLYVENLILKNLVTYLSDKNKILPVSQSLFSLLKLMLKIQVFVGF